MPLARVVTSTWALDLNKSESSQRCVPVWNVPLHQSPYSDPVGNREGLRFWISDKLPVILTLLVQFWTLRLFRNFLPELSGRQCPLYQSGNAGRLWFWGCWFSTSCRRFALSFRRSCLCVFSVTRFHTHRKHKLCIYQLSDPIMWCFIEMHNQCSPATNWEENLNSLHERDGEDIFNEVVMDVGEEGGSVIASTTILWISLR